MIPIVGGFVKRILQSNYQYATSEARAWSREGTGPYSFNLFFQRAVHSRSTVNSIYFTAVRNFLRSKGSLPSRRKACASLLISLQLRNPDYVALRYFAVTSLRGSTSPPSTPLMILKAHSFAPGGSFSLCTIVQSSTITTR